jgi:hypothetical protein
VTTPVETLEPSNEIRPARLRWRLPAGMRDVFLVILGALLALAAEEWRTGRVERRRAAVALATIRAELVENRRRAETAHVYHRQIADTLSAYRDRNELPPPRVYLSGVIKPALPLSTAWEMARETGALADLPYPLVLRIAPVYESEARYRALADGLAQALMVDVQHRGIEPVFRDGFANFIPVERDFANREGSLVEDYDAVIAAVDSAR